MKKKIAFVCTLVIFITFVILLSLAASNEKESVIQRKSYLRKGAGSFYTVIEKLSAGENITIIKRKDNWIFIKTGKGIEGWLPKRSLISVKKKKDPFENLIKGKGVGYVSKTDVISASKGLFDLEVKKSDSNAKKLLDKLLQPQFTEQEYLLFNKSLTQLEPVNTIDTKKLQNMLEGKNVPQNIPEDVEQLIGKTLTLKMISRGVVKNKDLLKKVNLMGTLLASKSQRYDLNFKFIVLDDKAKSSFALPGGFIFITNKYGVQRITIQCNSSVLFYPLVGLCSTGEY